MKLRMQRFRSSLFSGSTKVIIQLVIYLEAARTTFHFVIQHTSFSNKDTTTTKRSRSGNTWKQGIDHKLFKSIIIITIIILFAESTDPYQGDTLKRVLSQEEKQSQSVLFDNPVFNDYEPSLAVVEEVENNTADVIEEKINISVEKQEGDSVIWNMFSDHDPSQLFTEQRRLDTGSVIGSAAEQNEFTVLWKSNKDKDGDEFYQNSFTIPWVDSQIDK